MPIREIQNIFSLGELDPKLVSRADIDMYYKGARKARNVLVIPQGGLIRRFGQLYQFTVVDTGDANEPIVVYTEVNGIVFDFSPTKSFLVVARPNDRTGTPGVSFDIYLNNVLQSTETTTDYTIAQINDLYFLRAQDRVIILHQDVQPKELVRGANDTTWTLTDIDFAYYPAYDFSIIDGVSYRGATDTFTPSATSGAGITLTGSSAFFTAGHVGGIFIGGGGVLRITAVNAGGTIATGDTVEDFTSTAAIKGINALLLGVAWGDYTGGTPAGKDRGWPSRGEFFQNRLVLARTPVLPNFVSFSSSGDFYNFDDSESLDTNAFSISIGNDGNDEVIDVVGARVMVIIGLSGIYTSSLFVDLPITPGTAFLNEQDKSGADDVRAQVLDNQIFFVDDNKQKINAIQYDITSGTVNVIDASLYSPQLIDEPLHTAVYRPQNANGSFLLVANTDGTLAIFQSLINQQVQGWTLCTTQGSFRKVFASKDNAYALVERRIGTGATTAGAIDNVYIGNPDFESYVDITAASASAATDVTLFSQDDEYLLIGHQMPFYRIDVTLNTVASATIAPTFEYLDKVGNWTTFTPTDGTTGFSVAGVVSWSLDTDTPDWAPLDIRLYLPQGASLPLDTINGPVRKFWMRIRRTANTLATSPIENTILVNTATRLYIEKLDFNEYADSVEATTSNSAGLVANLNHLQGQQVYALVDDVPEGPFFVNATSQITVSGQSSDVRVGLNYIPQIVPMPVVAKQYFSQNVYNPKHIKGVFVDYFESLNITVDGFEIPQLSLNNFTLDQTPIPVTGFFDVTTMTGWDPRVEIEISQELPQPMTLLGLGYRLEVS